MAVSRPNEADLEKDGQAKTAPSDDGVAIPGETFMHGETLYAKVQRLAARFHVEQRGIERIPEDERHDTSLLNVGTMVNRIWLVLDTHLTQAVVALD